MISSDFLKSGCRPSLFGIIPSNPLSKYSGDMSQMSACATVIATSATIRSANGGLRVAVKASRFGRSAAAELICVLLHVAGVAGVSGRRGEGPTGVEWLGEAE